VAVFRSYVHLHRLVRQEEGVAGRALRFVWPVVKYVVSTQIGSYLGGRIDSIARLSPRASGKLDRFLSKGV